MRLADNEYEHLKKSVVDLFMTYKVKHIPISPFNLAKKMGIRCVPYSDLSKKSLTKTYDYSEEGFSVETLKGEWIIFYNDRFSIGTINNIIMHEISHYWLGHTGLEENKEQEESEASFFAKYSLSPPIIANRILSEFSDEEFKHRFNLSWTGASGAREYYETWINRPHIALKDYELDLIELFCLD